MAIEVIEFVDPPPLPRDRERDRNGHKEGEGDWAGYTREGLFHICITDPEPRELVRRVVENGGRVLDNGDGDGDGDGVVMFAGTEMVYVKDPWENTVEILGRSFERVVSRLVGDVEE